MSRRTRIPNTTDFLCLFAVSFETLGFSCKLLTREQSQFILDATSTEEMTNQLKDTLENFQGETKALIINGRSVDFALAPECRKDFLKIAMSCESVICCR
ncbi:unnamed protein product [Dibothriocephalus latus]|uniref:Uncharacterized protein n=1 Tax=Dibothriocephalus latus TaxID=60516 RepID=A0A3P7NMB6_DIBLA|nr:unnamed protein product [Dibothriocephalus latus]